jgi:hypothetical protein
VGRAAFGLACLALVLAGCDDDKQKSAAPKGPPPPTQQFHSRPDLKPPPVEVLTSRSSSPGYVFIAPKMKVVQAGPMILDRNGHVVWFHPLSTHGVSDFRVQRYHGRPVLTWWRGRAPMGVGNGYFVIFDDTYHEIARVYAGHGYAGDIHEFLITDRNTALFPVYHRVNVDLSRYGGPERGRIFDGIVQEVDIATGRVLFEWHSYPKVGLDESYVPAPEPPKGKGRASPWDYIHLNSIDVDEDGNLIVSARNTRAVYKIDRKTGKILWRLGGKQSDFAMGPDTKFAWQHDARRQDDGTITIFDNGAAPPIEQFSRVLVLRVDPKSKSATLVRSYRHPKRLLAPFEGNAQFLDNGNVFVSWGAIPYYTEFDGSGQVVLDARFGKGMAKITEPDQDADTYRAYRLPWVGHPADRPAIAVDGNTVYASWNGATEVARWAVLAGADIEHLQPVALAPKTGFETTIPIQTNAGLITVRALDTDGAVLGTSRLVQRKP